MRQARVRFSSGGPLIVLFAKSGFKDSLTVAVAARDDVMLVNAEQMVAELRSEP